MGEDFKSNSGEAIKRNYSSEQVAAFQRELRALLDQIAAAQTHYEVLGVDPLSTTGEIKLAYTRASALLNPAYYDLNLPQPAEWLFAIDSAFEKVSTAFSVLVNFSRRAEYDDSLFEREETTTEEPQTPTQDEAPEAVNHRRHQRFELSLPVRVSGYSQGGGKWQEMTQSVDVSVSGTQLPLSMPVRGGMILSLSMPMPATLRSHGFFESTYDVYAIVRRVTHRDNQVSLVGLEFLGEQPPAAYFEKPWGIFQSESISSSERRKAPRRRKSQLINLEYLDADKHLIAREVGTTEDVSELGMRVCVSHPPSKFSLVKVYVTKGGVEKLATLVTRFVGKDGIERLGLRFVDPTEKH
ncbi:MAG: DnaJ domain-containing protein [Acidobacteria bacterium]|nr:DnaJ domain-containing protein [Acidobacteriota bacterium]